VNPKGRVSSFDPNPSANLVSVERGDSVVILSFKKDKQATETSLWLFCYLKIMKKEWRE